MPLAPIRTNPLTFAVLVAILFGIRLFYRLNDARKTDVKRYKEKIVENSFLHEKHHV